MDELLLSSRRSQRGHAVARCTHDEQTLLEMQFSKRCRAEVATKLQGPAKSARSTQAIFVALLNAIFLSRAEVAPRTDSIQENVLAIHLNLV